MFARLLRMKIKIEKMDEVLKLFEKGVVPLLKTQKGFKGAYFLTNQKTGEGVVMTLWASEEDMLANERSHFFQEQVLKFKDFFAVPPIREAYEVVVKDKAKT